jgi:hypothetical protein
VYVTLMAAQDPRCEVFREKSTSYRGFCALSLHHNRFGRVHTRSSIRDPEHSSRYSESLLDVFDVMTTIDLILR